MFSPEVQNALDHDLTIDITTIGRKSGSPRKTEIWFHRYEDRYFITGSPGRRNWLANLRAHPEFTFHLKESATADLRAWAREVTDPSEKRQMLLGSESIWNKPDESNVDEWVRNSPMVEVIFENGGRE